MLVGKNKNCDCLQPAGVAKAYPATLLRTRLLCSKILRSPPYQEMIIGTCTLIVATPWATIAVCCSQIKSTITIMSRQNTSGRVSGSMKRKLNIDGSDATPLENNVDLSIRRTPASIKNKLPHDQKSQKVLQGKLKCFIKIKYIF